MWKLLIALPLKSKANTQRSANLRQKKASKKAKEVLEMMSFSKFKLNWLQMMPARVKVAKREVYLFFTCIFICMYNFYIQ
jgi:hypothetical protein